jgi:hypothetical protein
MLSVGPGWTTVFDATFSIAISNAQMSGRKKGAKPLLGNLFNSLEESFCTIFEGRLNI